MLYERLVLQNLGAFRGEHRLELAPTSPERPVVLLGALNGSGKTTVIEALQLALYGKRANYGWRGVGGYNSYLMQIRNRDAALAEPTTAEVTFQSSDGRRLRVRRQWSFTKDVPREFLSVYVNDEQAPDTGLSEGWDEEIERLLPARLSELFFFDGEKIEKLADPSRSGEVLRSAIASLMGLDLVDHLLGDLEVLRNRVRQRFLSQEDEERHTALNDHIRKIQQDLENVHQDKAQVNQRFDRAKARLREAQDKLQRDGGDRFQQRAVIASQRAAVISDLAGTQDRQREVAANVLPLSLVLNTLQRLRAEATRKKSEQLSHASADAIRNEWDSFLAWLETRPTLSKKAREDLARYATKRLAEVGYTSKDTLFNWHGLTFVLAGLIDQELPAARDLAAQLLADESQLTERLISLDEQQRKLPELEQLAMTFKEVGAAEEELQNIERELRSIEERERLLAQKLNASRREREAVLAKTLVADDAARTVDYCDRSICTLTRFRADLVDRRRKQLERLILEAFQRLLRKSDLVGALTLDPDSLAVRLHQPNGREIPAHQLSAGERQLLAIAMLWGLAQASGRPVPVVIDTPLGRLDGEHRRALVERYFPDASHQVILLSTDKEVDSDFSELLDDAVAHRYRIDYSAAKRSSSFTPGYFEGPRYAVGNG